jgi:cell division protein FtsI/penicillin-binding protein 2
VTFEMADGESLQERIFNAPAIDIWAKSGTADVAPFVADLAGQGAESFDGDHAWCVLLAGNGGKPRYAVAVVVHQGGSGGGVAGPVANQVVHALIAEGYLPRIPAGEPAPAEDTGEG